MAGEGEAGQGGKSRYRVSLYSVSVSLSAVHYLKECLASILKRGTGFDAVVLIVLVKNIFVCSICREILLRDLLSPSILIKNENN